MMRREKMKMKNKLKQLTSVWVLANGILAHAEVVAFKTEAAKGELTFKAIGKPAFLKIEGKGEGPQGKVQVDGKKLSGTMLKLLLLRQRLQKAN
jgi:hypothetical protein